MTVINSMTSSWLQIGGVYVIGPESMAQYCDIDGGDGVGEGQARIEAYVVGLVQIADRYGFGIWDERNGQRCL